MTTGGQREDGPPGKHRVEPTAPIIAAIPLPGRKSRMAHRFRAGSNHRVEQDRAVEARSKPSRARSRDGGASVEG